MGCWFPPGCPLSAFLVSSNHLMITCTLWCPCSVQLEVPSMAQRLVWGLLSVASFLKNFSWKVCKLCPWVKTSLWEGSSPSLCYMASEDSRHRQSSAASHSRWGLLLNSWSLAKWCSTFPRTIDQRTFPLQWPTSGLYGFYIVPFPGFLFPDFPGKISIIRQG